MSVIYIGSYVVARTEPGWLERLKAAPMPPLDEEQLRGLCGILRAMVAAQRGDGTRARF